MKGLIVLQRRFMAIGNAIARELKDRYGVEEFCGYVMTRRANDIASRRRYINYTDLLLDEELHNRCKEEKLDVEYLKKIEEEYGLPNLWPYLTLDRTLMMDIPPQEYTMSPTPPYSHEEMLQILQVRFRAIINFLEKEKPDFVVMCIVASVGSSVLYHVAKKMGIKTYIIDEGRVRNRVTFTENYKTLTGIEKIFKDIRENNHKSPFQQDALKYLKEFQKNPEQLSPTNDEPLEKAVDSPNKFITSIRFIFQSIYKYIKNPYKTDLTTENPWQVLINKIRRKIRSFRNLNPFYDKPDFNEDFAYFPLHFEPELATLLYAPFYSNQVNLIAQIAKSLPVHFKLYIKEHPSMLEYRQTEYYKELKKIPNLKLIDAAMSSFKLIQNSKLIVTISGTAGLEACFLKKPVITFADVFYNNISAVKRCKTLEDLPHIIKSILEKYKYDEREVLDFLTAIFEDSVDFDYTGIWVNGTPEQIENIRKNDGFLKFVANLAQKIGLKPTSNSL